MPQMAPLSWLNLFVAFVTMFLMMSSLNYFSFPYEKSQSMIKQKASKMSWKW